MYLYEKLKFWLIVPIKAVRNEMVTQYMGYCVIQIDTNIILILI